MIVKPRPGPLLAGAVIVSLGLWAALIEGAAMLARNV